MYLVGLRAFSQTWGGPLIADAGGGVARFEEAAYLEWVRSLKLKIGASENVNRKQSTQCLFALPRIVAAAEAEVLERGYLPAAVQDRVMRWMSRSVAVGLALPFLPSDDSLQSDQIPSSLLFAQASWVSVADKAPSYDDVVRLWWRTSFLLPSDDSRASLAGALSECGFLMAHDAENLSPKLALEKGLAPLTADLSFQKTCVPVGILLGTLEEVRHYWQGRFFRLTEMTQSKGCP